MFDNSIRDLLGFNARTLYEEIIYHIILLIFYHLIIFFRECDLVHGKFFKHERSGIIHNFTTDVDPGYTHIEKIRGNLQW